MSKIDLSKVSIVLSVKVDSKERLRNLGLCLDFYECFCRDYEIVIVEQDKQSRLREVLQVRRNVHHHFIRSQDVHWKTRNYNTGAKLTARGFLLMTDCDMFPHPDGLVGALQLVGADTDFVQVYNGVAVEIRQSYIDRGIRFPEAVDDLVYFSTDHRREETNDEDFRPLYGDHRWLATGGGLLCRRTKFFLIGGYNENFVSFGFEDEDFFMRAERLGGGVQRVEGYNVYHLEHPRFADSVYGTYYRSSEAEYKRACAMSADALRDYADKGFRSIQFDHDYEFELIADENMWGWVRRPNHKMSIGDITILVVARATAPDRGRQVFQRLADYLERNFENYDLLVGGVTAVTDEYGSSKKYLRYSSVEYERLEHQALVKQVLLDTEREYFCVVDLDDIESVENMISLFDKLLAGEDRRKLLTARSRFEQAPSAAGL